MKKVLCLLLVLAITMGIFFGCGKNPPDTEDNTMSDSATDESSETTLATEDDAAKSETETTTSPTTDAPATPPTTEAPSVPPTTQRPTTPPTAETVKPTEGQNDKNNLSVIAGGKWDGGPVTWKITSDGVLTISGQTHIQGKQEYIWKDYAEIVTKIVIEDGITYIPTYAFSQMKNVTSVYLGNAVKTIEYCAFANCISLTTITIPASTETIGKSAFSGCTAMTSLKFADGCKLQTINEYTFFRTGIKELTIPDNLQTIEAYAFAECPSLESVRLDGSISTVRAKAFYGCVNLKHIYFGKSITFAAPYMFEKCKAVTTLENYSSNLRRFVDFPKLTTLVIAGDRKTSGQYQNNPSLTSVTILSPITEMDAGAFEGCTSLTALTIPETVTKIGSSAFKKSGITKITIPAAVKEIGIGAFSNCAVQEITFMGDAPQITNNLAFENVTATVYYPAGNGTWTEEARQNYGGTLTWIPY